MAVNIRGKSFKIVANVEITDANASGVIFAHGSRFGGHSLFIKDHKLYYVYNFLGIKEQQLVSAALKPGKYTVGMEFTKEKAGEHSESIGTCKTVYKRQRSCQQAHDSTGRQIHTCG
ncbi:MAG: hypothetical protein MZV63_36305 [Marinilabiliales bacterium]|nr:hypothetical protein [Marinilabiliales bacterium]